MHKDGDHIPIFFSNICFHGGLPTSPTVGPIFGQSYRLSVGKVSGISRDKSEVIIDVIVGLIIMIPC